MSLCQENHEQKQQLSFLYGNEKWINYLITKSYCISPV